jgi:hypothetical protein
VKSTVVMRENLEEMSRQGLEVPVLLGGAALTRNYVEDDCVRAYASGRVAYARDAFDGLHLMDKVTGNGFDDYLAAVQAKRSGKARNEKRTLGTATRAASRPVDVNYAQERRRRVTADEPVPTAPFWGARVIEAAPKAVVPFINERSLYQFQWGFRKAGRSLEDFIGWAKQELRPVLKRMLALAEEQQVLRPQAIYGYWKCAGQGNDLVLFEQDGITEACRFTLPRQPKQDGDCIADFVRDIEDGPERRDVIGLQVVTVGQKASDMAREWFEDNRYQDYLYLHGLSVEMAEAMAEYVHKRIRAEWGFGAEDDRDMDRCSSRLPRRPLLLRLSRLPEAGGPRAAAQAAGRRSGSAFRSRTSGSSTRSNRPAPSCCTTRGRSTSRSSRDRDRTARRRRTEGREDGDAGGDPRAPLVGGGVERRLLLGVVFHGHARLRGGAASERRSPPCARGIASIAAQCFAFRASGGPPSSPRSRRARRPRGAPARRAAALAGRDRSHERGACWRRPRANLPLYLRRWPRSLRSCGHGVRRSGAVGFAGPWTAWKHLRTAGPRRAPVAGAGRRGRLALRRADGRGEGLDRRARPAGVCRATGPRGLLTRAEAVNGCPPLQYTSPLILLPSYHRSTPLQL